MLGHAAQSVGGALPGAAGVNPLLGQTLLSVDGQSVDAPARAAWAFVEVVASGGHSQASNTAASAGGAGSDAIVSVSPGDVISAGLPYSTTTSFNGTATVSVRGSVVIQAASAATASASNTPNPGPSGKYPGGPSDRSSPGIGGGRLAGKATAAVSGVGIRAGGAGAGASGYSTGGSTIPTPGGRPLACVTFFTSYDAALAFANALYGGNWQP